MQQSLTIKIKELIQKLLKDKRQEDFRKRLRVRKSGKIKVERDYFKKNYSEIALNDEDFCLTITLESITLTSQNIRNKLNDMNFSELRILFNVLNQERKRLKENIKPAISIGESEFSTLSTDSSFYLTDVSTISSDISNNPNSDFSQILSSSSPSSSEHVSESEHESESEHMSESEHESEPESESGVKPL